MVPFTILSSNHTLAVHLMAYWLPVTFKTQKKKIEILMGMMIRNPIHYKLNLTPAQ